MGSSDRRGGKSEVLRIAGMGGELPCGGAINPLHIFGTADTLVRLRPI